MLLEVAIGDAYGSGFEFVSEETILKEHKLKQYYASRIDDLKAGQYTDDTQMTLAIAELMLTEQEWTQEIIAKRFLDVFNRDKRCGYAKGFFNFLSTCIDEYDFVKNIQNDSVRNGAAMRSVPLSLIKDKEELLIKAKIQASVTHNTHEGIISSQAVALIGHYFLYHDVKKENLKELLFNDLGELFMDDSYKRVPCAAIETIDAVLTVLKYSDTLSQVIDQSVNLGGDTDSVASIACGLASLTNQYKNDLPDFLYNDLENDTYGKDYIIKLNEELLNKMK